MWPSTYIQKVHSHDIYEIINLSGPSLSCVGAFGVKRQLTVEQRIKAKTFKSMHWT